MSEARTPFPVDGALAGDPSELAAAVARMRADGHDVLREGDTGALWFLDVDDAEHLLTAPEVGAGVAMGILALSGVTDGPLHRLWSHLMFGKDGNEHRRIRRTVARRLTAGAVESLRPAVEQASDNLLSAWAPGDVPDLWATYALPLVARSACTLVGVPADDAEEVARWSLALSRAFGVMDETAVAEAQVAVRALLDHLDDLVASDRLVPGGVWSDLVMADGGDLTEEERRALGANLLFGGMDATAKAITTGLAQLMSTPPAWAALVADPVGVAPHAVAETLRLSPPAVGVVRLAASPISCRGVEVDTAQLIGVSLDAVCRDPAKVDRPDELDIGRPAGKQYAFGAGPHLCVGAPLARLVVQVAFADLATRFPQLEPALPISDLPWTADPFRGIVHLPVRVPAAGASDDG